MAATFGPANLLPKWIQFFLRLMTAQDLERRHIARELHDSAGQTLTALGMILAQLAQDVRIHGYRDGCGV